MHPMRQCGTCTLLNAPERRQCDACGSLITAMPVVYVTLNGGTTNVTCPSCDASNPVDAPRCFICGGSLMHVTQHHHSTPFAPHVGGAASAIQVDDDDEDMCAVCMSQPADHRFVPCGHAVLCGSCAHVSRAATSCYVCRHPVSAIQPVTRIAATPRRSSTSQRPNVGGVLNDPPGGPPRPWRAVQSTFPWFGGDVNAWPSFVTEIKAAGAAFVKMELGNSYPQAHIKECVWSAAHEERVKEGWRLHACPEGAWAGIFAWHASSSGTQGVQAISRDGYDPATRSRNNHGTGEYFGVHHSQSTEYGRNNRTQHGDSIMLVNFILRGKHVQWVEDFCFICNNPKRDDFRRGEVVPLFAVPLFIVHFTKREPPNRWSVPRFPYRWQFGWHNDELSDYIAYDHDTTLALNQQLCLKYSGHPDAQLSVEVALRQNHDPNNAAPYRIDLVTMTQTNEDTRFLRRINVVCVPPTDLPKTLWMVLHDELAVDRRDAQHTSGADRRRHDRNRYAGTQDRPKQFWMVLDMFVQRALSAAYFAYYGLPDPVTGKHLDFRKVLRNRYSTVFVNMRQMRADLETLKLHYVSRDSTGRERMDEGIPLAVVDS
jgi:hypothetical protein